MAESRGLGALAEAKSAELAEARKWRVEGFPKVLVFHLPMADGIRVLRVLHAAQDWKAV